jgi:NAD(P)-dependent dehydrogenase (short-subunit alcohol dehydrogenase family)
MTEMQRLPGRHAVITGAGRGIGASIAERLAQEGVRLTLLGRSLQPLQELAARLPAIAQALTLSCDVSDEASVAQAFAAAQTHHGAVNLLINNAGQALSAPIARTTLAQWQQMLAVNLTGSFLCIQAALPAMRVAAAAGTPCRIVNIASTAGLRGYAYVAAYTAAKHGVIGLTRALALELATQAITVNAVCPGYTDTDLVQQSLDRIVAKTGRSRDEALAELTRSNPQGRLVSPAEVADSVAWLCGDAASSITGQAISVSGGEVM